MQLVKFWEWSLVYENELKFPHESTFFHDFPEIFSLDFYYYLFDALGLIISLGTVSQTEPVRRAYSSRINLPFYPY